MDVDVESLPDLISDWDSLYNFCKKKNFIIDDDKEGIIVYNIHISKEYRVFCMKGNTIVPVREHLGFAAKLQRYSKLDLIIEKLEIIELDLSRELKSIADQVSVLSLKVQADDFISHQINLQAYNPSAWRYPPSVMKQSIGLYL